MNQILITGATGFVGKNVVDDFARHQVGVLHTPRDIPKKGKFDYIINFASISSVERSIQQPADTTYNNLQVMLNVLELARKNPPKLLIQFSTIETKVITNPYAASKKAQEDLCLAYSRTYDIPILVIHSTNIVGPGQSPEKFVPKLISQISAGEPVTIYTTAGVLGSRYYNPVKNVAGYLRRGIAADKPHKGYHQAQIPGAEKLNNLQLAQKIAKLMGKEDALYKFVDAEEVRPSYLAAYEIEPWPESKELQSLDDCLKELIV